MKNGMHEIADHKHLRGILQPKSTIIAVGGGKGGVGKSFASSSIAIFLANMGYKTLLVDADLGAANIHTVLGEGLPERGLSHFLTTSTLTIDDIAVNTKFANLRMISGNNDALDMANVGEDQKSRIMSALFHYPTDYIVLDLSAGTHQTTLDFFLMAQEKIVTFTPDPSSVENAYRFIKAAFFRRIKRFEAQLHLSDLINRIMANPGELGIKTPAHLLNYVMRQDEAIGEALAEVMGNMELKVLLNQSRTSKESELGHSIESVITKYFGVPAEFLGAIDYDNAVWQALRKRKPLILDSPHSRLYAQLLSVTRNLTHPQPKKAVV